MLTLLGLLVWTRCSGLHVGFWNDEAFSALYFIERGPAAIFFHDGVPDEYALNDHRLFSLLAWGSIGVLGDAEVVYRLWSVVPGIAAAVLVVGWATRRLGRPEAVVLVFLVLTAPLHAELVPQARGYGLAFLAEAMILIGSDAVTRQRPGTGYALLAAGGAIGTLTLPPFAATFLAQSIVLVLGGHRAATLIVASVALIALGFHWPVIAAIGSASGQRFGELVRWRDVLVGPARDLFAQALWTTRPQVADWLRTAAYAPVLGLAASELLRRREATLLWLLTVPVAGTYAALAAYGAYSVPRYVSYLLLHVLVAAAVGIVAAVRYAATLGRVPAVMLATLLLLLGYGMGERLAFTESYRARLPIEGYREAMQVARAARPRVVVTNSRLGAGFQYYGRDLPLAFGDGPALGQMLCDTETPFVFVDYPLYGWQVDETCLNGRRTMVVPIPQTTGTEAQQMTVVIVPP